MGMLQFADPSRSAGRPRHSRVAAVTAELPPDGSMTAESVTEAPLRSCIDVHGAVIIPAHDEAAIITRTLSALRPLLGLAGIEVVVACNGCHDDTAAVARTFPGVIVAETSEASKTAGLNLGDRTATQWPRLYLDADIDIAPAAVVDLFGALAEPGVFAARPRFVYDAVGATLPVRAYYRARTRIPAPPRRMWGAGGYATNAAGHDRFERFPQVTSDDSWFDAQFADAEKRIVATAPMRVRTPRDTGALLGVLARQRRGHVQLGDADTGASRVAGLLRSVHHIDEGIDAAWYVALTLVARVRLALTARRAGSVWERDLSSRVRKATA